MMIGKINSNVNFGAKFSDKAEKCFRKEGLEILKENGVNSKEFMAYRRDIAILKKLYKKSTIDIIREKDAPYESFQLTHKNGRSEFLCFNLYSTSAVAQALENKYYSRTNLLKSPLEILDNLFKK